MTIFLAILVGGLFGFVLHRVGAGNPQNLINMLRLQDLHLAKVILLAIGFSSLILFALLATGSINEAHIDIKAAYAGVIIGGLIFGIGFAIAGYCPGTCLVGVGGGRKDALVFIFGGLVGAILFTLSYGGLVAAFPAIFSNLAGGEVSVANTGTEFSGLSGSLPAFAVAGVIAIVFMVGAWVLPKRFNI